MGGSEIVNLEERSESHHNPLSLGPAVVTDDEGSRYPVRGHDEKVAKHQQVKKVKRHRRTASMGSNIDVPHREPPNHTSTLPLPGSSSSKPVHVNIVKPKPMTAKQQQQQQLSRPGSAGSNPVVGALHRMQSPEKIKETAHEVMEGITKLIEGDAGSGGGGSDGEGGGGGGGGERVNRMRRVRSGGGQRMPEGEGGEGAKVGIGEGEGSSFTKPEHPVSLTSSLPIGIGNKSKHKHDNPRGKHSSKSSDTASTDLASTAHPAPISGSSHGKRWTSRPSGTGWLKKFSRDKSAATTSTSSAAATSGGNDTKPSTSASGNTMVDPTGTVVPATASGHTGSKFSSALATNLSRTPSILSTSSTISTFPPSTLPSRNPSFAYDGGGESSPHSLESMEIGDSIENLLALQSGRMNYSYFIPIRTKDMTSSSDEDSVRGYRHSRRKRSSGTNTDATAHSTQQSKGRTLLSIPSHSQDFYQFCFTLSLFIYYQYLLIVFSSFLLFVLNISLQMKMTIVTRPTTQTFYKGVVGQRQEEAITEGVTQTEAAARLVLQSADTRV